MKKFLLFPLVLLFAMAAHGQDSVLITFHLNMNSQTVDPGGVYIAGGAGFGVPGDNQMTDPDGDGVYSIVMKRPENWSSHYTFLNGNCPAWNCKENIAGQPCADPANFNDRFLSTSTNDTTITTCFAICSNDTSCVAATPDSVNITFHLNMNNETVDPGGVYLAGGAGFGLPGDNQMTDPDGDGVYSIVMRRPENWSSNYTFLNGNCPAWNCKEDISGQPCADPANFNDRFLSTSTNDTTITTCFAICSNDTTCMIAGPDSVNITFHLNMNNETVDPGGVYLAGGAGFGLPGDNQMTDPDGDGVYSIVMRRPENWSSNYTFLNGNCPAWNCKEDISGQPCADPANFNDRFLSTSTNDTTITTCFAICSNDTTCVIAAPDSVNITFNVNMNNETVDPTGVYLAGGAGFGVPGDNQMTDPDGDGVYSIVLRRPANWSSFYTHLNGNCPAWNCKEDLSGQACADPNNFNDRFISTSTNDTTVTTCFAFCSNDTSCTPPMAPDSVNVTFHVNMRQQTVAAGGVYVGGGSGFGSFNTNQMSDPDGDDVYSITLRRPAGFSSHYIFLNGGTGWGDKEQIGGLPCADPNNFNDRFIALSGNDTTVSTCYEQCSNDTSCATPPSPVNITFRVNMAEQVVDPMGVYIGANFDGWSGGIQMDDSDGDNIWEYTHSLAPNFQIEWKFVNGPNWPMGKDEMFDPATSDSICTITGGGFTNRLHITGTADEVLTAFCFDSCGVCRTVGLDDQVFDKNLFKIQPNRVKDLTTLVFSSIATVSRDISIFDATGRQVMATTIAGHETRHQLQVSSLTSGMYFITVRQDDKIGTQKMIVVD